MKLQTALRKRAKIKLGLQGPSGSGKTYSSLLLAYGLTSNWDKIAVVDTENHSAELYSHLGPFKVLPLLNPYTPEKYVEAIDICTREGMEVVILDSITHEWENLIDFHSSMAGNSFTNWGKVTPRHNAFVQKLLQAPVHIISTIRTKQDYVLNEKNGRIVPEKVGLKSVQRDGLDYEFTLMFDLDIKNNATASKDRTGLFFGKPECKLSEKTGELIRNWCNDAEDNPEAVRKRIADTRSIAELLDLYNQNPYLQESLKHDFQMRKKILQVREDVMKNLISNNPPLNLNGKH